MRSAPLALLRFTLTAQVLFFLAGLAATDASGALSVKFVVNAGQDREGPSGVAQGKPE